MLRTNAMMNPTQPRLEVREDQMNQREPLFSHTRIAALRDRLVLEPILRESVIGRPVIGNDVRPRCYGLPCEAEQRLGATIRHDAEAQPAGVPTAPTREGLALFAERRIGCFLFPRADFDRTDDADLMVYSPAFAARSAAD